MAIFHFSGQVISRGKGQSATAAAAYRSGDSLFSERYNKTNEYKRLIQPETYLMTPSHAPKWASNRETLWNEVEKIEKQKNSQLAREFNVALPNELSNEEQTKLAKEFCEDQFVSKGMVADLSIHRDDLNNPHFHVMLTMRGFKNNGDWDSKARKVNGNKINTNDWGDKETLNEWRKQWASYANESLERNGIDQRISHMSYEDQGKIIQPTIHEGYYARKLGDNSERVQKNKEIKNDNRKIITLEEKKKELKNIEQQPKIIRQLAPKEKKELASLSKELKTHVNFNSLKEKKEILNKWHRSESLKNPANNQELEKLNYINGLVNKVDKVDQILEKEADRFLNKNYPDIDKSDFTSFAKQGFVNNCIESNSIPNSDEAVLDLKSFYAQEINHELAKLSLNPYATLEQIKDKKGYYDKRFKEIVKDNDIDFSKPKSFENADVKVQKEVRFLFDKIDALKQAQESIDDLMTTKLMENDLNSDVVRGLSIEEKDLAISYQEYTGERLDFDTFDQHSSPFSTADKEKMIDSMYDLLFSDHSNDEFSKPSTGLASFEFLFFADCFEDNNLSKDSNKKLEEIADQYAAVYDSDQYFTYDSYRNVSSLSQVQNVVQNTMSKTLYELSDQEREKMSEMRKAEGRNQSDGLSL